jgi:hypothetical protein
MAKMKNACTILAGKSDGSRPLGRLGVDGRVIREWILGR